MCHFCEVYTYYLDMLGQVLFESHRTAFLCKADTTFSKSKATFTTRTLTNDLSENSVQESVFESRFSLAISFSTAGLISVGLVYELCLR